MLLERLGGGLGGRPFLERARFVAARVAYRLALDHRDRIERIAVLDIVQSESASARADSRFALGFWLFWSLLAQPEPLRNASSRALRVQSLIKPSQNWGSPSAVFSPENSRHAICEE